MLCALCSSAGRMQTNPEDAGRTRRGSAGPRPESGPVTCDSCGRLVAAGSGEGVVETLAHLARFGLTGQTILTRKRA
jgi:hypothetical protein